MDRLGWTAGKVYVAYGMYFGVRSNSAEIMDRIVSGLPFGVREARPRKVDTIFSFLYAGEPAQDSRIKRFNLVYRNGDRLVRVIGDVDGLVEQLQSDIQLCVAEMATTRVFMHAGVVGWKGKAIVIPGRSQSGKSTLVQAFIKAGATYYSDEYALIDRDYRIHPFARPIQIRDEGTFRTRSVRAEDLGATIGRKALPVGLVLFTKYKKGVTWRPRRVSGGRLALQLLRHCVSVRRQPGVLIKLANQLASSVPSFASKRGEAGSVVRWCRDALDTGL